MSLKQRLGKRGFFLKLSPERLVHEAVRQDPIFKKEDGVFVLGCVIKGSRMTGLDQKQSDKWGKMSCFRTNVISSQTTKIYFMDEK